MKTPQPTTVQKEVERIVNKYPWNDSKELFRSELEYLANQAHELGRNEAIEFYEHKLAQERNKVIEEVESWLVDEKLTVVAHKYGTETGEIKKTIGDGEEEWKLPRNELRAELRTKLNQLKGTK